MDRPTENPASKALQYCCVLLGYHGNEINNPLHSDGHVLIVAHVGGSHNFNSINSSERIIVYHTDEARACYKPTYAFNMCYKALNTRLHKPMNSLKGRTSYGYAEHLYSAIPEQ
jgi:hypothetical protein